MGRSTTARPFCSLSIRPAGDPSSEIVATARDEQADLVVLGKHHHSGLAKFFSLDTADAVERELPSELVVVD